MKKAVLLAVALVTVALEARADERIFGDGMREPQVAVAPDGCVFLVAAKGDGVIEVTSSSDGKSFGAPVRVGRVERIMLGMRRGPRIAATAKFLVVTAIARHEGVDGELLAWSSADRGATWRGPVRVNGEAASSREGLDGLAAGPKDEVACVWLDNRGKDGPEVWVAVSTDGGLAWREARAYKSPEKCVCQCCHPSVAWTAKGELALMWRNWLEGSRDLWLARSRDHGRTFEKAEKLGRGTWPLDACPMDGGAVAAKPEGGFATIWRRADSVFLAVPGKPEERLGAGCQGWLAAGPGGFFAVWLEKRGGTLEVLAPGQKEARAIGEGADDPAVAGALDGKGPVVATWLAGDRIEARVLAPRK